MFYGALQLAHLVSSGSPCGLPDSIPPGDSCGGVSPIISHIFQKNCFIIPVVLYNRYRSSLKLLETLNMNLEIGVSKPYIESDTKIYR